MGGGKKTSVTNTGLGDSQFSKLTKSMAGMSDQVTNIDKSAEKKYNRIDRRFDSVDTNLGGISRNLNSNFSNVRDLMGEYNTGMNTQFDNVNTNVGNNATALAANNATLADNNQALGSIQTDVSTGFEDVGTRFDTVDTANTNLQNSVNTGFVDQQQSVNDLSGAMTENAANIRGDVANNFEDTNTALAQAEGNIRSDVEATQANVLGGQSDLASNLSDLSTTTGTYFSALSDNQNNIQTGQEEFKSSFDDYVERYADDTTLSNQTRADLQSAQATGFDRVRNTIGTVADANAAGQQALAQQADSNNNALEGQLSDTGAGFMANQQQLVRGQQALSDTFTTENGQLDTALINQARNLARLTAGQENLDAGLRQNFSQLANAFDENGQLVQNSIDASGNTILRKMDLDGNLMLRALNVQGQDIGSKILNVNTVYGQLQELQSIQNPSTTTSGFASPFINTGVNV